MKGFSSQRTALKVDVIGAKKYTVLQARPCMSQPRKFTGWGREGVKRDFRWLAGCDHVRRNPWLNVVGRLWGVIAGCDYVWVIGCDHVMGNGDCVDVITCEWLGVIMSVGNCGSV